MLSAPQLAGKLHNSEYPFRLKKEDLIAAKENGLVVVYGASDDLMEFEGVFCDEVGVNGGGKATIDAKGVLADWELFMENSPTRAEAKEFFEREKRSAVIEAVWDSEGYSFVYKTTIPHVAFDVVEGDEKYCRGIVFSVADITRR